jgi:hypothetical protein
MGHGVQENSIRQLSKSLSGWELAIYDANQMILEAKEKVRQLKIALRRLERLKANGVPYPKSVEAGAGEPKTEKPRRLHQASE